MAYLKSFFKGTTVEFNIPISALYSSLTLNIFSKVTVVISSSYGETKVLNESVVDFHGDGIAKFNLSSNSQTNIDAGKYYYEIFLEHDTNGSNNYDVEYVIESGRIQIKDRV